MEREYQDCQNSSKEKNNDKAEQSHMHNDEVGQSEIDKTKEPI